jgi:hypothetical protein
MMKVEQAFMPVPFLKKPNRQECLFHMLESRSPFPVSAANS